MELEMAFKGIPRCTEKGHVTQAQTAGVIGIKSVEGTEKPRAVYFLTIDKCKFRKGRVVYCGKREEAVRLIAQYMPAQTILNFANQETETGSAEEQPSKG